MNADERNERKTEDAVQVAALFINLITIAIIMPLRRRPALIKGYNSDVKGLVLNFTKVPLIRVHYLDNS